MPRRNMANERLHANMTGSGSIEDPWNSSREFGRDRCGAAAAESLGTRAALRYHGKKKARLHPQDCSRKGVALFGFSGLGYGAGR